METSILAGEELTKVLIVPGCSFLHAVYADACVFNVNVLFM